MVPASGDDIWKALANPIRRHILDLLRDHPATTGAVAAEFPDLSRYAVMQHLGVLCGAELVVVRRRGRERFNHLNPVPLRRAYERWVSRFAGAMADELLALERHVERSDGMGDGDNVITGESVRVVRLAAELRFRCTPERLFRAMTVETTEWFPYTYGGDRTKEVVMEPRVGGLVYEDWGDGAGHLYGQVTTYDPPRSVTMRTRLHLGTVMDSQFEIEADGDTSILRSERVVIGPISDEEAEGIRFHGDLARFADAIRSVVEAA